METIKSNQYGVIAYFLIRSFFLGMNINSILDVAKQDSWISVILGFIIGFIPMILYYLLLNHDENLNINGLIDKYFNKYLAFIIKLLLILFLIFHASILLWNIGNFVGSQYLYKTPIIVILIVMMIPIFYINIKSSSTMGRTSIIFFIINIALALITVVTLGSHVNLSNLLPTFEYGLSPILNATITSVSYSLLPLFTLLIIPKKNIQNNNKLKKNILIMYSIATIILLIVIIYVLTVLSVNMTLLYEYPEFNILKMVNIGDFIQRIESILSLQWFFDIAIGISFFIYYIKTTISEKIKINNNILVLILSVIIIIIARKVFINNTVAYEFLIYKYKYIILFFLFVIPLLILIRVKTKK